MKPYSLILGWQACFDLRIAACVSIDAT